MHDQGNDPFDEALGPYIGPATRDEIRTALLKHSTGPVIERVCNGDGTIVSHRSGWPQYVDALGFYAEPDQPGRFILSDHDEGFRFNPVRRQQEVRPAPSGKLDIPDGAVEQHVGGYAVRRNDGTTVGLVLWHASLHVTDSGDVAPGLGGFSVEDARDEGQS